MGLVVDIHCHNFNGDDLPVKGFVQHVVLDKKFGSSAVAAFVDLIVQTFAIGYDHEVRQLDGLLSRERFALVSSDGATPDMRMPNLESRAMRNLAELIADEELYGALADACAEIEDLSGGRTQPGIRALDRDDLVRRHGKQITYWATLFASPRIDNTLELIRTFTDEVDLYTPMLVDLEIGLKDKANTSVRQQIELQHRISRLSMMGRLPGVTRARVHPFVGFDPRRGEAGLETVQRAVRELGFIGVKVYPPMGFRPLRNKERGGGPPGQDVVEVDRVLRLFYKWCRDDQVPITAHCNSSNGATKDFDLYSHPDDWRVVLQEFPGLHLNLGHFGGMRDPNGDSWSRQIATLATSGDDSPGRHVYADVGCHDTRHQLPRHPEPDEIPFADYPERIAAMFNSPGTAAMADRLMYGTDWYMNAREPAIAQFMSDYRAAYEGTFGPEATARFMGARALSFLGFDDPDNQNSKRLRTHYALYAPDRVPEWLA